MIFITGANGLVGSFVVRAFLMNGRNDIVALKRPTSDLSGARDFKDKIAWADGDIRDIVQLEKLTKGVDTVIHCAALVSFDRHDKNDLHQINVEGTKNIVNACIKNGIPKLLHVSSISAFISHNTQGTVTENSKRNISSLRSNYGITKYQAELEVWRGNLEGLRTVIVNPSVVIGPGNWQSSSLKLFDYVRKENVFMVDGYMNCVDARDLADIIYALWSKNCSGEQYIINAERIAYKDFFASIALQFNKKPPRIRVPLPAIEAIYGMDQIRSLLSGKKAILTREIIRAAKGSPHFSSAKIMAELGFKFRPIEDTIRWTCREMMDSL